MNEIPPSSELSDGSLMKGRGLPKACETCGQDAAIEIEGRGWCAACLHAQGSCCGESEKDGCPD
jgi:hypothetical protein